MSKSKIHSRASRASRFGYVYNHAGKVFARDQGVRGDSS